MPIHMADIGSDNYEQEFSLSLMENEGAALEKIVASLERIEDGSYGTDVYRGHVAVTALVSPCLSWAIVSTSLAAASLPPAAVVAAVVVAVVEAVVVAEEGAVAINNFQKKH